MRIGLDILRDDAFRAFKGKRVGIVCNQASVDSNFQHILTLLTECDIRAVFGPQHGLFGTTQDNMIEWDAAGKSGFREFSLYGEHRKPTPEMLEGLDVLVIDLPDVGSRYYTFVWTMSLCIEAAEEIGLPIMILDRPNPISGAEEGSCLEPEFASFVGHRSVPARHGLTAGEIASTFYPGIEVVQVEGWNKSQFADEYGYAWVMPSPNMPTLDTAIVYPGGCLLEATNLSEGRGTTRPFELVGAPWLDSSKLAESLNALRLNGVYFRPTHFEPTFNKYQGQVCQGVFVHVLDRRAFQPLITYVAILQECTRQTGLHDSSHVKLDRFKATSGETELGGFAWKQPPYEYVYDRMPIDILAGNAWLRKDIEALTSIKQIQEKLTIRPNYQPAQLYPL
jgi:uncharacterized protein YbbC (DUF1343 family)